jgi:hypothetical protein
MKNNKSLLKSKSGLFELGMKLLGLSKVSFNGHDARHPNAKKIRNKAKKP